MICVCVGRRGGGFVAYRLLESVDLIAITETVQHNLGALGREDTGDAET